MRTKDRAVKKNFLWKTFIIILFIILFVASTYLRFPKGNYIYQNEDATYHQLLTLNALEDNFTINHLFLPIVNFGRDADKYIPWGGAVSDPKGNYFYTSFYSPSFVLPYFALKGLHLDLSFANLYLFNTFLFLLFCISFAYLIYMIFGKEKMLNDLKPKIKYLIFSLVMILVIFSPQIMHSMGVIYWGQSVFQVTLTLQFILFYKAYIIESKKQNLSKILFLFLCLFNPLIEWTGYVANGGFFFAVLLFNKSFESGQYNKEFDKFYYIKQAFFIAAATALSPFVMMFHYILAVDYRIYLSALKARFMDRSATSARNLVYFVKVLKIYYKAFELNLVTLLFGTVLSFSNTGSRCSLLAIIKKYRVWIFLFCFIMLENILMIEHVVKYPFDSMKFIFLLSLLYIVIFTSLLSWKKKAGIDFRKPVIAFVSVSLIMCSISAYGYLSKNDKYYMWEKDYPQATESIIPDYVNSHYDKKETIMSCKTYVRGYESLKMGRSMYELKAIGNTVEILKNRGGRYAVNLSDRDYYLFSYFIAYDKDNDSYKYIGLIYDKEIINTDFIDLSLSDEVKIFTPDDMVLDTIDFSDIESIDERISTLDNAIESLPAEHTYLLFSYSY